MTQISISHTTSTGHRIVGHEGKCARLHGHTYRFEVTLEADALVAPGFVLDFGVIKALLDEWDHRLVLWEQDPIVTALPAGGSFEVGIVDSDDENGVVRVPFNPTAENMARHLATRLLGDYVNVIWATVEVHESGVTSASFTAHKYLGQVSASRP